MKFSQLPKDILECNIFYYLNETDLIKISLLNREFHSRMYPMLLLAKLGITENFWPEFKFIRKEYSATDAGVFAELQHSSWKFIKFTTDSTAITMIQPPKTKELNLVIRRISDLNKFLSVLDSNIVTELRTDFDSSIAPKNISVLIQHFNKMSRLQTVQIHAKLLDSSHALALQNTLALTNISVLDLKTCGIDDEFIAILCNALLHSRVQVLDLYSNRIGNDGVQRLAQVLSSTNIKQLVLSYNRFNIHGLQQLSSGLINSKVTSLKIPSVRIDPEPIQEFFDNIHLMNLEALELYRNIGVENTQMLLNSMTRSNLKKLEIEILTEYLPAFLKTVYHSKVTDLHLISNDPDECCRILAENKEYMKLDKLRIGKGVTAKGLKDLFSAIKLVKELDLQENFKIGDKEMEIISKYLPKTNLQKLVLSGCSFKDDGLASLMNGLQKSSLQYLELRYMKASTEAVVSFMKGVCDSLKVLDISYGNMLDFARIRAESMRYPRLKVIKLSNW